jgi:hypothetical protein
MKRLDDRAAKKETTTSTVQAMDSHMMCEVYGDVGHSRNNHPKTQEEPRTSITGSTNSKVIITGGTISLAHKEVIQALTQITIQINLP